MEAVPEFSLSQVLRQKRWRCRSVLPFADVRGTRRRRMQFCLGLFLCHFHMLPKGTGSASPKHPVLNLEVKESSTHIGHRNVSSIDPHLPRSGKVSHTTPVAGLSTLEALDPRARTALHLLLHCSGGEKPGHTMRTVDELSDGWTDPSTLGCTEAEPSTRLCSTARLLVDPIVQARAVSVRKLARAW